VLFTVSSFWFALFILNAKALPTYFRMSARQGAWFAMSSCWFALFIPNAKALPTYFRTSTRVKVLGLLRQAAGLLF
jgi:hypothetical protein